MNQRQYKTGVDRQQGMLLPPRIDEYVEETNPVRALEAYVATLDMAQLGFTKTRGGATVGQPAYAPAMLLKLYLWGYLNRTRSSRRLERETYRNLEVIWLLHGLHPCYKTIADFRKENPQALKAVYKDFLLVCRALDLFGGELVGIDSVFLEGDASKASIYTGKRLDALLARLDEQIEGYLTTLDQQDAQEPIDMRDTSTLTAKVAELQAHRQTYQALRDRLSDSGDTQLSCTDPDARLLQKKTDKGPTAGYNAQCAVDSKYKLIVAGEVVNEGNDTHQLAPMATQAKANLGVECLTAAADASYYNQPGLKACEDAGITPYVAIPDREAATRQHGRFARRDFHYQPDTDSYRCPADQSLPYSTTYEKDGKQMRKYLSQASVCAGCSLREQCLPEKTPYRQIARWEHEDVVERHHQRMADEGQTYMRTRAGLAEHPFGTLKVWCGWTHFLVRGLTKVRGEWHLLLTCYNFKRVLNILGLDRFRAYCQQRATARLAGCSWIGTPGANAPRQEAIGFGTQGVFRQVIKIFRSWGLGRDRDRAIGHQRIGPVAFGQVTILA
jgi:transposase